MLLIYPRPVLSQNWPFASFTCSIDLMIGMLVVTSIQGQECGTSEVLLLREFLFSCEIKWHCFDVHLPSQESRCWLTLGKSVEALLPLISFFPFVEQIVVNAQQCEGIFAEGKNVATCGFCYPCFFLNFVTFEVNLFSLSVKVLTCSRMWNIR